MKVLVVFTDEGTHPLSFLLKKGFRHVLCAFRHGDFWAVIDSGEGIPIISVSDIDDLSNWYQEQNCVVVEVDKRYMLRSPFIFVTCVSLVKAAVGIRSLAITPWQLYQYLKRNGQCD